MGRGLRVRRYRATEQPYLCPLLLLLLLLQEHVPSANWMDTKAEIRVLLSSRVTFFSTGAAVRCNSAAAAPLYWWGNEFQMSCGLFLFHTVPTICDFRP